MWQAALIAYAALAVVLGVRSRATTLEDFVLGDTLRQRTMIPTVVSTFYGASAIFGGVSLVYQMGLSALWFIVPFYLGSIVAAILLGRVARSATYTLPDFLGGFYGDRFAVSAGLLLVSLCLVPEEIIAGGKILSTFTAVSTPVAMVITTFVVAVPVVIGGMKADVSTDVVQFVLMGLMLALLLPVVVGGLPAELPSGYGDPFWALSPQEMGVFLVSLFFLPITSAPLYQRFFAAESEVAARRSLLMSIGIWVLIDAVVLLAGFAAVNVLPGLEDPDLALVMLGARLPAVLRLLFIVGGLAAILSTVNSFLQSGASSLAYDVIQHLRPSLRERNLLGMSRLFVVLLSLSSLGLALWFREIVPALLFTLSMWTAGMVVPTLAALTKRHLSRIAALSSLWTGVVSSVIWKIWHPMPVDPLFVGLACSLMAALIVDSIAPEPVQR